MDRETYLRKIPTSAKDSVRGKKVRNIREYDYILETKP